MHNSKEGETFHPLERAILLPLKASTFTWSTTIASHKTRMSQYKIQNTNIRTYLRQILISSCGKMLILCDVHQVSCHVSHVWCCHVSWLSQQRAPEMSAKLLIWFFYFFSRTSGHPESITISKSPWRSNKNIRILHKPKSFTAWLSIQNFPAGPA